MALQRLRQPGIGDRPRMPIGLVGAAVRAQDDQGLFAGVKGLTKFSPRSGVTVGVTYDTPSIFKPAK